MAVTGADADEPVLATAADGPVLAAVLAAAFRDDVMIRWPMPHASPEVDRLLFAAIIAPYFELGVQWKSLGGAATAAWLRPDVASRFAEIDAVTRAAIYPLTSDGGQRYERFWDWLDGHLPAEPCWYLDILAVDPAAQGRGLGRVLVAHGLKLARAEGCPAFLETGNPRNVGFYESLGFQVTAHEQAPDGGPHIWFMQAP